MASASAHPHKPGNEGDASAKSMSRCQVNEPKCEMAPVINHADLSLLYISKTLIVHISQNHRRLPNNHYSFTSPLDLMSIQYDRNWVIRAVSTIAIDYSTRLIFYTMDLRHFH